MDEFLSHLQLEKTRFTMEVFFEMDRDLNGSMDFQEFVMSVWRYATKRDVEIVEFAFDIFDTDNSGVLTEDELKDCIGEIYGKKGLNESTAKMLKKFDKSKDGKVSKVEFLNGCKQVPQLLYPAFSIQNAVRRNILGEGFWEEKTRNAAR